MVRWQFLVIVAAVAAGVAGACTDDDPPYGPPSSIAGKHLPGEVDTTASSGGGDGGGGDGVFASAYDNASPAPPTFTAAQHHADGGGPMLNPQLACVVAGCHGGPGPTPAPAAFAGYLGKKGGGGQPSGEVAVLSNGVPLVVKTDADGYFWLTADAGTVAVGSKVEVRDSTGVTNAMVETIGNGNCNSATLCHGANGMGGTAATK